MQHEWDAGKAEENLAKHGVSFEDGATVFDDPWAITVPDVAHSEDEERHITVGRAAAGPVLTVVYTMRGDTIRITSAREATRREQRQYEEGT